MFLATDLFLFAFFWELMLIPMYFLIDLWGHENRHRAAVKFFLFTQIGGLLMLVSIIGLAVVHGMATARGPSTPRSSLGPRMSPVVGMLLMLGFFAAFAVKLPAFPLHTWLPDAHTEAPTAGSVILAGLLLKTGGYGLIRFAVPLFPAASRIFAPGGHGAGGGGHHLRRDHGVQPEGHEAPRGLHQREPPRVRAPGRLRLHVPGALSGAVLQMVSHGISTGGALHPRGRPAGQDPHAGPGSHGRPVEAGAANGRGRPRALPWRWWACRGW